MLSLKEAWIKAAVEHIVLTIEYFSARTKRELTRRAVEPDYVGVSRDGKNRGFFTTHCHLRRTGPRCFKADSIGKWAATEKTFKPSPHGRWRELVPIYNELNLKNKSFQEVMR